MSDKTQISWTDATWSPVTGCTRISDGCTNCHIERTPPFRMAHRRFDGTGVGSTTGVQLHPERLRVPMGWRKPRKVFVCSMADLFHAEVPDNFIGSVFDTMGSAPQHVFQVLTKRPARLSALLQKWEQCAADDLNLHPSLLGPLPNLDLTGIDWVIVGGESGPGARPMHPDWARDIRDQCQAAGVPFHFKQHGEWISSQAGLNEVVANGRRLRYPRRYLRLDGSAAQPFEKCALVDRVGKRRAGRELDGRAWDEYPKVLV